jgi:hypothetical protein
MHYYLRHPVHGTKVAISDMEMAADFEHGWEEYDPLELIAQGEAPAAEDSAQPGNELRARRKRKE